MDGDGQAASPGTLSRRGALRLVFQAPDSYGLVLALLVLSFLLAPIATGLTWLWIRVLVQGATLLFALHTSRVRKRALLAASTIVGISLVLAFAAIFEGGNKHTVGQVEALLAILLAMCVPAMLRRILTAPEVSFEVVVGAMDVYIIFGMFFSATYSAIGDLSSQPFFAGHSAVSTGSYQFFSFVTLTTVGYGNLVPATTVGQSLATAEALFGQIYLVTLVARLVSAWRPGARQTAQERLESERQHRAASTDTHDSPRVSLPAEAVNVGRASESGEGVS